MSRDLIEYVRSHPVNEFALSDSECIRNIIAHHRNHIVIPL